MNKIAANAYELVKDFASHHRKITAFQKIVAVSLILGVSAVIHRNIFCLLICLTYLLLLACAIFITNHIIYANVYVRSDMVLTLTVYFSSGLKSAFCIIRSICVEVFSGNGFSSQNKKEYKVQNKGNPSDHGLLELSDELSRLQPEHGRDSTFDNLPQDPEGSIVTNNKSVFYLSCIEDEQESNSLYLQIQDSGMTQDEPKSWVHGSVVNQKSLTTECVEVENSILQDKSVSFFNSELEATSSKSENVLLLRNRDIEEECTSELGKTIDDTVNNLLKLIHRDFVNAWYQMISSNTEAPDELYAAFESIAEQFKVRLSQIDYHCLAGEICCLFQKHLQVVCASSRLLRTQSKRRQSLGRSKSNSTLPVLQNSKIPVFYLLEDCYDSKWSLHPALKDDAAEMKYIQSVTGILIEHCVPTNLHCSQTVQILFNEILTSNIFMNVLHHLCEPVFIFEKIIQISSNEEICLGYESGITSDNEGEAINTVKVQSQNNIENHIVVDNNSFSGYSHAESIPGKGNDETLNEFQLDSLEATQTKCSNSDVPQSPEIDTYIARNFEKSGDILLPEQICSKDGSSLQDSEANLALVTETAKIRVDCSNIESCVDSSALIASSSSAPKLYLSSGTVSSEKHTEELFVIKETQTLLHPSIKIFTKSEKQDSEQSHMASSLSLSVKCLDSVLLDEKNPSSPVDQKADDVFETDLFDPRRENPEAFDQKTARNSSLSVRLTDSEETTLDVSLHKTFHNALIAATDTRRERGTSSSYTLYKVEYDAFYPDETGELVPKKGMVWRRFREFINLQVRLEDNPEYKKSLKGVKGPKRWQLPFRNMDKYTVETRKKVLEAYLKGLIDKPDICNGPELKEFLGYEGDGRIAFVRKPSDVGVRRIDQMLVRTVSGVFDKIVERLPSLPQDLPSFSGKKEESKEDDIMPSDDVDVIDIDFSISEKQTQSDQLSLEHILERFTQLKGLKSMTTCEAGDITLEKSCTNADIKETVTDPKDGYRSGISETETKKSEAELPVATHVLDILVEILSNQDNWELTNVITVFVRCSEGTRVIIDVKVDPVNEFPTVFRQSSYDVTMEESTNLGEAVFNFTKDMFADEDVLEEITLRFGIENHLITEFNGFGKFNITPAKGTVYPTQMFDSDTLTLGLFYLNITITDIMNRTTWSKLTVNVTDVDDNGPVFTTEPSCKSTSCRVLNYTGILSLDDGLVYNLQPAPILAVDGDKTLNAQVTYKIIEAQPEWYENFVTINESGLIEFCTVCENFTTIASRIELVIQAMELTYNQFSANVTVMLEVQAKENKSLGCCNTSPLPTDVIPNCCGTSPLPTDVFTNCCGMSASLTDAFPNCCGTSSPPTDTFPNCCGTSPLHNDVFPNCCGTSPPSNDTFPNNCNCTLTTTNTNGSKNELAAYVLKIVFPTCAGFLVIVLVIVVVLVIRKRNTRDSTYDFKG